MFETGTYVVCGQHGVCKVEDVGNLSLSEASKEKEYYTLRKVYSGGVVYVPADSDKVVMRQIYTREEAEALINEIEGMDAMVIENEKNRDAVFKQALRGGDNREVVRVLKNLYQRKKERQARGKRMTASDERYTKMAEDALYGELAISLNIDKKEVHRIILDKVRK